jgi:hypothetical protein
MEGSSSIIAVSMGVGGGVFLGFILFWFLRGQHKRRFGSAPARTQTHAWQPQAGREDLRSQPRTAVAWKAEIHSTRGTDPAEVKDISLGGAFVACRPLALDEPFRIRIHLPAGEPLLLGAVVVWSNAGVPPDRVIQRGMGIRFTDVDPVDRKRIADSVGDPAGVVPPQPPNPIPARS